MANVGSGRVGSGWSMHSPMMHRVGFFSGWVGDGQINSCYCSFCPSLCLVCRSGQSGPHNFYSKDELAVIVSAPIVRRFVRSSGADSPVHATLGFSQKQ